MLASSLPGPPCHQGHLPSDPPGLSWAVALVQDRSLGHPMDECTVLQEVSDSPRAWACWFTAQRIWGDPSRTPLQHDSCQHMHRNSQMGFIFVFKMVQCGGRGWGQSQTVTPLVLKAVSRGRSVLQYVITLDVFFHWDPRSSPSRKGLALPEASSENKGKAVN